MRAQALGPEFEDTPHPHTKDMPITADELFARHFLPLYPKEAQQDLERARTTNANPGDNPSIFYQLHDAAARFADLASKVLECDLVLDFSDASVHRLSAAITDSHRARWFAVDRAHSESELFNFIVHGAIYVGECVVRNHNARWLVRHPLWESLVALDSAAGEGRLSPFSWWLRSIADATPRTTLADRYRTHVEVPCFRATDLPIFLDATRPLPRIKKVRYDVLYKYIKAHLPELRDLGSDFPTPERFSDYHFSWLRPVVVGEGRMLVLDGQNTEGAHLFWLGASGFEKALFIPCDTFPEHRLEIEGEKLRILTRAQGELRVHEVLWWGP